jgi:hypothetical protein
MEKLKATDIVVHCHDQNLNPPSPIRSHEKWDSLDSHPIFLHIFNSIFHNGFTQQTYFYILTLLTICLHIYSPLLASSSTLVFPWLYKESRPKVFWGQQWGIWALFWLLVWPQVINNILFVWGSMSSCIKPLRSKSKDHNFNSSYGFILFF